MTTSRPRPSPTHPLAGLLGLSLVFVLVCGSWNRAAAQLTYSVRSIPLPETVLYYDVADVDGDGVQEVLVSGTGMIHVVDAASGSALLPAVLLPVSNSGLGPLAVGDFNGDLQVDYIVGGLLSPLVKILVSQTGTQQPLFLTLPFLPSAFRLHDVNDDGDLDLVATGFDLLTAAGTLAVLTGDLTGNLTLQVQQPLPDFPLDDLVLTDINGDGTVDFVVMTYTNTQIGSPPPVQVATGGGGLVVVPGVPLPPGGPVIPSFGMLSVVGANYREFAVLEANNDGFPDIVVLPFSNTGTCAQPSLLIGNGLGGFWPPVPLALGCMPDTVVAADFDADGLDDLLLGESASGTVQFFRGTGAGAFSPDQVITAGPLTRPRVVDLENDGSLEVIFLGSDPVTSTSTLVVIEAFNSPAIWFLRGDASGDGSVNIGDAIALLGALFVPGYPAPPCRDALDANDDGSLDIGDGIHLLNALFVVGSAQMPPPSAGLCGEDPTADLIDCLSYPMCVGLTP